MGTQITVAAHRETTTFTPCSPALDKLLTSETLSWQGASELIAHAPEAIYELDGVIANLDARMEPCGVEFIISQLAPLRSIYGIGQKSQAEWGAFWKIYAAQVETYPREAVVAAVSEYVGLPTSEFFPKPGPLKALCEKHTTKLRLAIGRARNAKKMIAMQKERRAAFEAFQE